MPSTDEEVKKAVADQQVTPPIQPPAAPVGHSAEPSEKSEAAHTVGGFHINSAEERQERGEKADTAGKVVDAIGHAVANGGNVTKAGKEMAERVGGGVGSAASFAGDVNSTVEAAKALAKPGSDKREAASNVAINGVGAVQDAAGMLGNNPVATYAGALKGGLEIGKGAGQVVEGLTTKAPAPGQSARDGKDEVVDGVENLLKGTADGAGAMKNPWVAGAGKALGAGMAVGNLIAPLVFGKQKEEGSHMEQVPADEHFNPTTGNRAVDWVFGTGKYTNGRW